MRVRARHASVPRHSVVGHRGVLMLRPDSGNSMPRNRPVRCEFDASGAQAGTQPRGRIPRLVAGRADCAFRPFPEKR